MKKYLDKLTYYIGTKILMVELCAVKHHCLSFFILVISH